MKIAFFSDVHANLPALEEVLEDMKVQGVRKAYSLGDVIGYGPHSFLCLEALLDSKVNLAVNGNHEMYYLLLEKDKHAVSMAINNAAFKALLYAHEDEEKRKKIKKIIKNIPEKHRFGSGGITLAHGSCVDEHMEKYVTGKNEQEELENAPGLLSFIGHTHCPRVYCEDGPLEITEGKIFSVNNKKIIINVGSVGQPRDKDPRACYVILDVAEKNKITFFFRRIEYDVKKAAQEIYNAGLPHFFGERLLKGI